MTKANSAELIFIVDRSGSMHTIRTDMEGGFRTFIEEQRKVPGECFVTLTQFDDKYEVVYTRTPLSDAPALHLDPRGSTALLDAMGRTITETGLRFERMPAHERPDRVLVIVITDGHENASAQYSRARVFEMIKHQRELYKWEFLFLGANQDAIDEAGKMGIANAMNYASNSVGVGASFRSSSKSAARYRGGGALYSNAEAAADYAMESGQAPVVGTPVPVIVVNVPTIAGAVKPGDEKP